MFLQYKHNEHNHLQYLRVSFNMDLSSDSGFPPGVGDAETESTFPLYFPLLYRESICLKHLENTNNFTPHKYQGDHDRCYSCCLQRLLILKAGYSVPCILQMISVNLVFHQGRQSVKAHCRAQCLSLDAVIESLRISLDRMTWQLLLCRRAPCIHVSRPGY